MRLPESLKKHNIVQTRWLLNYTTPQLLNATTSQLHNFSTQLLNSTTSQLPMWHNLGIFAVSWAVIYLLRAFPFIICARASGNRPWLKAAEKWLSPIVIAILVVYSYSGLEWRTPWPYIAGFVVVALQLIFKNGLLSIFAGTALYMLLV